MRRETEPDQNFGPAPEQHGNVYEFPGSKKEPKVETEPDSLHQESLKYLPKQNFEAGRARLKRLREKNKAFTLSALDKVRNLLGNKSRRAHHKEVLEGKVDDLSRKVKAARVTGQVSQNIRIEKKESEDNGRFDKAA